MADSSASKSTAQPSHRASRGASARNEGRRFAKFLVVGAAAFVVETAALSLFALVLQLDPTVAKGFAFVAAVLSSFLGNQFWTYRDSRSKPLSRQLLSFLAISLVGLVINVSVFHWVHGWLDAAHHTFAAIYGAHGAAVATALVWNFLANRLFTYGDVAIGR